MSKSKKILIIEDDEGDQLLMRSIFNKLDEPYELILVSNGREALDLLNQINENDQPQELPHLIILDLNMPIMDGKTFIHTIREISELSYMPIIVLSTSDYTKDVMDCFQIGANSYLSKPLEYGELTNAIKNILNYWFNINILPGF